MLIFGFGSNVQLMYFSLIHLTFEGAEEGFTSFSNPALLKLERSSYIAWEIEKLS